MITLTIEERFRELLQRQKELEKYLKTRIDRYYNLRKIAEELAKVEDELWDNAVFGMEDVSIPCEEKFNTSRKCDNIYYFVNFLKEDEEERDENYYYLYGTYMMSVPPFYKHKEFAMYYNLKGGSKVINYEDRHLFENDNYVIFGKRPILNYKNIGEYNMLMKTNDIGDRLIMEDFNKYQAEFLNQTPSDPSEVYSNYVLSKKGKILFKREL